MVPRLKPPSIQRHRVLGAGPRCPPGGPASDELRPGRADAIYDLGCIDFYIHTQSTVYIYIYVRTLSGPHFSTFLEMQCFCYIMFDHLCSYTCDGIARDPHRLSDFLRGCQRLPKNVQRAMKIPREKEGGKTHIVCVYTLGERWPRKGSHFFYELPPSPSPPIYSPPIYIDGLAFSL